MQKLEAMTSFLIKQISRKITATFKGRRILKNSRSKTREERQKFEEVKSSKSKGRLAKNSEARSSLIQELEEKLATNVVTVTK